MLDGEVGDADGPSFGLWELGHSCGRLTLVGQELPERARIRLPFQVWQMETPWSSSTSPSLAALGKRSWPDLKATGQWMR